MKLFITVLLVVLFLCPAFGQKKFELPDNKSIKSFAERLPKNLDQFNLKDLQTSTDSLNIRIWQTHTIFTLNYNNTVSSDYKIHTTTDNPTVSTTNFSKEISQNILDSILASRFMELSNENFRGIDGSIIFIEIATKNNYKVVSFWSPTETRSDDCKTLVNTLSMLNKTINSRELVAEFKNALKPGGYRWGMSSIQIDQFLDENSIKTDFYSDAEERIKSELNITQATNHWEYPLVLIDEKPTKIAGLNKYLETDIELLEILKPDKFTRALYGTNAANGVVKVNTKQ